MSLPTPPSASSPPATSPPASTPSTAPGLGWPQAAPSARPAPTGLGWPGRTHLPPGDAVADERTAGPGAVVDSADRLGTVAGDTDDGDDTDQDRSTPLASALERELAARIQAARREPMPVPERPRTMVVANQKGGVGKTTTTVNVAAAMAMHGLSVVVVDLDPQGNASTALDVEHGEGSPGVYDVLLDGAPLDEVAVPSRWIDGLLVVPASIDLAGAEIELVSMDERETRLRHVLTAFLAKRAERHQPVDYVLIDCPPSLGLLTLNALVAAEEMLIPIQCEYYALEGLGQLVRNVELVRQHLNPRLTVSAILLTMFDARTRLSAGVAQEVRAHFGEVVLRTSIPRSVRLSEAPSHQQTVLTYDPYSAGALSYVDAAREITGRPAP